LSDEQREDLPRFAELDAEYEILRELGRGGTAVVYLAREREIGRQVAIKVVRATYVEDEEAAARLVREARTVAGLRHPNIVMLYGTRRLRDGSLALIMQYIHGRTLKDEIGRRGPLSFPEVERILTDVGTALAYAQHHRILHRDIKPENVYLDEETGRACLSDFGIARAWDDSALTLPGTAIGTPAYMSPEQVDGAALDARSDIYSLGLVAWEMLTGRAPWAGESLFRMIYKQKHEDLPGLAELRPDTPTRLRHVVERSLRKDPAERWANADEFVAALKRRDEGRASYPYGGEAVSISSDRSAEAVPAGIAASDESQTIRYRRDEVAAAGPSAGARAPAPGRGSMKWQPPASLARPQRSRRTGWRAVMLAAVVVAGLVGLRVYLMSGRISDPGTAAAQMAESRAGSPDHGRVEVPAPLEAPEGEPGAAAVAFAIYGNEQDGTTGDTLPTPLVLRVEDAAGQPVPGATVTFTVTTGRSVVAPDTALTDEHGLATVRWLPQASGLHVVEASVVGVDREAVEYRARVSPRPAARLAAASSAPAARSGGTSTIAVRAEDDRGNPVVGAEVRFAVRSGGGRIERSTAVTGRDGTAAVAWTLGSGSVQEATATLPNGQAEPVVFRAASEAVRLAVRAGVATGGTHTCAVDAAGAVLCWGGNDSGQLGDGSAGRRTAPARVTLTEPIARLSAGVAHTCGVTVSGTVFCWGANDAGQLGDGTSVGRAEPVPVGTDRTFTDIFAGATHTCGLDSAGRLYCWGQNTHGQLGDGSRASRTVPVRAGGGRTFTTATVGWNHTCAIAADGAAYCWGRNTYGELGDGRTADRASAAAVAGGHRFTAIAAGSAHTCALRSGGEIMCWGQNDYGQLGNGSASSSLVPVIAAAPEPFAQVTVGGVHTCGLTRAGAAYCWGRNSYGQLGDGTTQDRLQPGVVEGGHRFVSLQASGAHTCGTAAGIGGVSCWGFNIAGQLGDGTRVNRTRPVAAGRQG
jgi:serine/threonine protein kinase/alpha-tubulin suppressor-like RCC1 family protein